jgi:hypothetical protein
MTEKIWLAKYDHRHGEDLSAHRTREGALARIAAWASEWIEDVPAARDPAKYLAIKSLIADPDGHRTLLFAWREYTDGCEDMNLEELEINE